MPQTSKQQIIDNLANSCIPEASAEKLRKSLTEKAWTTTELEHLEKQTAKQARNARMALVEIIAVRAKESGDILKGGTGTQGDREKALVGAIAKDVLSEAKAAGLNIKAPQVRVAIYSWLKSNRK